MKNKKNIDILLITDNGFNTVGGEQESTKIIIDSIKNYFSIGVIQPGKVNNVNTNVEYYSLTTLSRMKHLIKHPLLFIKYILNLKKIINAKKPKIIHTQSQISFFIVAICKKLLLISSDSCFIHTERGLYAKYNGLVKHLFYFCLRSTDVLITTTNFNMNQWRDALDKKNMSLEFVLIENTAGALFENYDLKHEAKDRDYITIGFAGRYCTWKNWPLAIEISKKINDILGSNIKIKMAVGCLDSDALTKTEKMFKTMDDIFKSRFEGKINLGIEEMEKFYYHIDIFILTSNFNSESFGRTLVEAMSRKTVVLTTDAGGTVEIVNDDENVCSTSNDFVNRIMKYYSNRMLMDNEKLKNLQRVQELYSLKNNFEKHLQLYKEKIDNVIKKY